MNIPKATNTFIFIIRDEVQKSINERVIPGKGRVKPHKGKIFSVGSKVTDKLIKGGEGKTAVFHQGIGQNIEIDGTEYLCLEEREILSIL